MDNSRALDAIYNRVDQNVFKLINTCSSAKEAWKILKVVYKGIYKGISTFESLRMTEDETIVEFNVRVLDIANEFFVLGERISESKPVRKLLRFLPKRFNMKVSAMEEAHDIESLKLDELFGSLHIFEISKSDKEDKKM